MGRSRPADLGHPETDNSKATCSCECARPPRRRELISIRDGAKIAASAWRNGRISASAKRPSPHTPMTSSSVEREMEMVARGRDSTWSAARPQAQRRTIRRQHLRRFRLHAPRVKRSSSSQARTAKRYIPAHQRLLYRGRVCRSISTSALEVEPAVLDPEPPGGYPSNTAQRRLGDRHDRLPVNVRLSEDQTSSIKPSLASRPRCPRAERRRLPTVSYDGKYRGLLPPCRGHQSP